MRFLIVPLALAATAMALPTLAQADPDTAAKPVKPKKPHKICRDTERPGSHMLTTVCKTQAEWDGMPDVDGDLSVPGNRVASGRALNTGTKGRGL